MHEETRVMRLSYGKKITTVVLAQFMRMTERQADGWLIVSTVVRRAQKETSFCRFVDISSVIKDVMTYSYDCSLLHFFKSATLLVFKPVYTVT